MKRAFLVFSGFAVVLYILFNLLSHRIEVPEILEFPPAEDEGLALVVDTHSDTLVKIIDEKTWLPAVDIGMDTEFHIDIPKLRRGGVDVQYFGAYTSGYYAGGKPDFVKANSRLLALFNAMYWTVQNNPRHIGLAMSMEDIEDLAEAGKVSAVLSVEGAYSLEKSSGIWLLRQYHDLGVRMMGLVWNHSNELGEGVNGTYMDGTPSSGGLTDFGREVVAEMNRLGIIVDVSHMNEATFWDVMEVSKAPVVASHSGAFELRNHPRNLKDDQIRAVAEGGGVVQVVFYPRYLAGDEDTVSIETIADHIEYITDLVGVEHVGIGSDFDGAAMPKDLKDASMIPRLKEALKRRGFSEVDIEKIMGKNTLKVMREIWGKAGGGQGGSSAPVILPDIGMGEGLDEDSPVLSARIKSVDGTPIDASSLKVIIDGRVYEPEYSEKTGVISLRLMETLREKFHVVTFQAASQGGNAGSKTRIFHIQR
jgi:membrane dipeptidase